MIYIDIQILLSVELYCNSYAFTPIPPIPDLSEYKLPVVAIHISTIMDFIAQEIRRYYEKVCMHSAAILSYFFDKNSAINCLMHLLDPIFMI